MKTRILFAVLVLMAFGNVQAQNLYESLKGVNARWAYEKDLPKDLFELPAEENPIQTHLFWVHRILSERPVAHLTPVQRKNRLNSLESLSGYAEAGVFPKNLYHRQRQPVFIDPYNTYCAVGHLIKTSGHDPLARKISKQMNYAYLLDMEMSELDQWVAGSGFTPEELAWIQPGYPSIQNFRAMKEGTNGPVYSIHPMNGEVLVAGEFDSAGVATAGSMSSWISGVAGYGWIPFGGTGVDQEVFDMVEWNGDIVVGGNIWQAGSAGVASGVAIWDGTQWQGLGNFYVGALPAWVYDVEVYNNELYAAGFFRSEVNASVYFQNFAKWDGTEWVAVGSPDAPVTAMTVHDGKLILGGSFQQIDGVNYDHIAAYNGTAFENLGSGLPTDVKALESYNSDLFVGCRALSGSQQDTFAFGYYDGTQWTRLIGDYWQFPGSTDLQHMAVNALEATPYGLFAGGNFTYPTFGTYGRNLFRYNAATGAIEGFGILDSTVHSLAYAGGDLYIGGDFKTSYGPVPVALNHMTYVDIAAAFSTDELLGAKASVYPNPASTYAELSFENPVHVKDIRVTSVIGQTLPISFNEEGNGKYSIDVSQLSSGTHVLSVHTDEGVLERKLMVSH
ncbi:MAG: T9SS type A sorting domain-containing protein [Owenweeksia sp.]